MHWTPQAQVHIWKNFWQKHRQGFWKCSKSKIGTKESENTWEELNITSIHELMEACQSGRVAKTKGFGEKTQKVSFSLWNSGRPTKGNGFLPILRKRWLNFREKINAISGVCQHRGGICPQMEIIESVEWLIATTDHSALISSISSLENLSKTKNPQAHLSGG